MIYGNNLFAVVFVLILFYIVLLVCVYMCLYMPVCGVVIQLHSPCSSTVPPSQGNHYFNQCNPQTSINNSFSFLLLYVMHITKMALPNFPVPELDVTLQEVNRVLQLISVPDLYSEFKSTLEQQRELLQEVHEKSATIAADQENWVTKNFKRNLLSCADPLPTSTALPFVLLPMQAKQCTQLMRAAALLWAAAKLHSEPLLLEGNSSLECTQQSELFGATRIPGRDQDEIKVRVSSKQMSK